jgi:hypothetical protein
VLQIYEGANEVQQMVVARAMRKQAEARDPVWPECMPEEAGAPAPAGS